MPCDVGNAINGGEEQDSSRIGLAEPDKVNRGIKDCRWIHGYVSSRRPSSYKAWTTIKRIYAARSRAKVQQLKSALQNLKKGTESIIAYFHKAKGIDHQLAMASKPVDEDDLVMNILFGLPEDYGTLKVSLRTRVDPINLEELYSLLLIQESEISKPASLEDPSAYIVHRQQNFKNHHYRGKPEQQKRHPGHRPQDKTVNCHACVPKVLSKSQGELRRWLNPPPPLYKPSLGHRGEGRNFGAFYQIAAAKELGGRSEGREERLVETSTAPTNREGQEQPGIEPAADVAVDETRPESGPVVDETCMEDRPPIFIAKTPFPYPQGSKTRQRRFKIRTTV
ncbi:hypothetical protein EJ110_NYTH11473 [Nymphaea thermarum]|nr:hypothetical protein EJ110_NYTH11473 [Nymphaea thermarum]